MQATPNVDTERQHSPSAQQASGGRRRANHLPPPKPKTQTVEATITFCCPACNKILLLDQRFAGMDGPCPKCGKEIISADPARGIQARLAGMPEPPIERKVWTPKSGLRTNRGRLKTPGNPEPRVLQPKPPPLGKKIASIADMPRYEEPQNGNDKEMRERLKKAMTRRERMSLRFSSTMQVLKDPNTLSWIRTILSLLAIGAVVAGIMLLRSKG